MLKNKPERIIIDTNLWVSFIISKKLSAIDSILYTRNVGILFSAELIREIEATILKPKLRNSFKEGTLQEMWNVVDSFVDFVNVKTKVSVCRDPKDDFLLALAIDGKADYLITGDNDFLSLKSFENTQIVTFPEFIEKIECCSLVLPTLWHEKNIILP